MTQTWAGFEARVRDLAQYIWRHPCSPGKVGGVAVDGAIQLDKETWILIEVTEDRSVNKVRTDIEKLRTAKSALFAKGFLSKCFCIIDGHVTAAMKEAAEPHHITVMSGDDFAKLYFDFESYRTAREMVPFGSAVNPVTGDADETKYVSVKYVVQGKKDEVSAAEIANWVRDGRRVVLLGEYGTGKSRCLREVFKQLSFKASERLCYPIAIDLRKSWGLVRGKEIIDRHFFDLGLKNSSSAIRAFNAGSIAILIDGFDEIGTQAWSNDAVKLAQIRAKALSGVKNLVSNSKGGVLLTGREHYFPSSDEMFSVLGLDKSKTIIARCKEEFSNEELEDYFTSRNIFIDVPSWIPRRPLICQTIGDLADDDFDAMFVEKDSEVKFWDKFIDVLCVRDARIHESFSPEAIYKLFISLARITRNKTADVGPISLAEIQNAFEAVVGTAPVEEASVMLQRLPSLGRVGAESQDRQFVDIYILDGLRAKDLALLASTEESAQSGVMAANWTNALGDLGQRVLAQSASVGALLQLAEKAAASRNRVLASDLVASLMRFPSSEVDFRGLTLDQGEFTTLTLNECRIANLTLKNSYFGKLVTPALSARNAAFQKCTAERVVGVSAASGLPDWITELDAESYDSVENISRIRKIGLGASHEILAAIVRKIFHQKGSGRKEEALLRGLGSVGAPGLSSKIINILMRENIIERFKGDSGWVYTPIRSESARMMKVLVELKSSQDPIWIQVGKLN